MEDGWKVEVETDGGALVKIAGGVEERACDRE